MKPLPALIKLNVDMMAQGKDPLTLGDELNRWRAAQAIFNPGTITAG